MADGSLRLRLWKGGTASEIITGAGVAPAGAWRHVAFSYDGTTMRLFVDGAERASGALAGPVDMTASNLYLGSSSESYDWLAATPRRGGRLRPSAQRRAHPRARRRGGPPGERRRCAAGDAHRTGRRSTTTDSTPALAGGAGTAAGDSASVTISIYSGGLATGTPVQTLTATPSGGSWARDADALTPRHLHGSGHCRLDSAGNVGMSRPATFTVVAPPVPIGYRAAVARGRAARLLAARRDQRHGRGGPDRRPPGHLPQRCGARPAGRARGEASPAVGLDGLNDSSECRDGGGGGSANGMCASRPGCGPPRCRWGARRIARKEGQYLLRLCAPGRSPSGSGRAARIRGRDAPGAAPRAPGRTWWPWDGATMRVYVNGGRAPLGRSPPRGPPTHEPLPGLELQLLRLLAGALDEVAVYAAALPPARIRRTSTRRAAAPTRRPRRHAAGARGGQHDGRHAELRRRTPAPGDRRPVERDGEGLRGHGADAARRSRRSPRCAARRGPSRCAPACRSPTAPTRPWPSSRRGRQRRAQRRRPRSPSAAGDPVSWRRGRHRRLRHLRRRGDRGPARPPARHRHDARRPRLRAGHRADFANCYDPTWGRHKARTDPTVGDHEYLTPGAAPYFNYFGAAAGDPAKGYYSYDLGTWHVVVAQQRLRRRSAAARRARRRSSGCGPDLARPPARRARWRSCTSRASARARSTAAARPRSRSGRRSTTAASSWC